MALGDIAYRGVMKQASAFAVILVTPSDTEDLPDGLCRGILLNAAGTANIIDAGGTLRSLVPLQAGYNWIATRRVLTGGTATGMWALY